MPQTAQQIEAIGTAARPLRVAVVGSGPAGFYLAQALLKQREVIVGVDMFERLPTPYGLVRGGVAPDHQSIKSVTRIYDKAALQPGFRFLGNVTVGRDLSTDELRERYDQIVYAIGNETSRRLGLAGEGLWNSTPATVFVGWYNGHPDYRDAPIDLSQIKRVAVVGNGNVAIDVARILGKDPEELARTDIAEHALEVLQHSAVEEIVVLGRRGPVQAAFTPAELKELGKLTSAQPRIDPAELELDEHSAAQLAAADPRTQRNLEILREYAAAARDERPRKITFRFLVSPVEIAGDDDNRVRAIRIERNRLTMEADRLRAVPTGETEELAVQLVLPAIGYRGRALGGVPFDEGRGLIPNAEGRVTTGDGAEILPNEYVVGWARTGPQGLIGAHKAASGQVASRMLEDLATGRVPPRDLPGADGLAALLEQRGSKIVSFDDWKVLDEIEVTRGRRRGAPRSKVSRVDEMIRLIDKGTGSPPSTS
jgi:ferredoxin--NADP+ reductase